MATYRVTRQISDGSKKKKKKKKKKKPETKRAKVFWAPTPLTFDIHIDMPVYPW